MRERALSMEVLSSAPTHLLPYCTAEDCAARRHSQCCSGIVRVQSGKPYVFPCGPSTMGMQLGDACHVVQGLCECSPATISSPAVIGPCSCSSATFAVRFRTRARAVRRGPSLPLQSVDHAMQLGDSHHAVQVHARYVR